MNVALIDISGARLSLARGDVFRPPWGRDQIRGLAQTLGLPGWRSIAAPAVCFGEALLDPITGAPFVLPEADAPPLPAPRHDGVRMAGAVSRNCCRGNCPSLVGRASGSFVTEK